MALLIRKWQKWQGAVVKKVLQSRKARNIDLDLHYAMSAISMTCAWDNSVMQFAATVNTKHPEAYIHRLLAYAAHNAAFTGVVNVPRKLFGRVVMSSHFETVSRKRGEAMYDAFIKYGICVEVDDPDSVPPIAIGQPGYTPEVEQEARPEVLPETPCLVLSGRGTPPSPQTGGENGKPRKMRKRDRERLPRVLRYHAVVNRDHRASRLGSRLRKGELSPDEMIAALDRYGGVTPAQLTNFERNG